MLGNCFGAVVGRGLSSSLCDVDNQRRSGPWRQWHGLKRMQTNVVESVSFIEFKGMLFFANGSLFGPSCGQELEKLAEIRCRRSNSLRNIPGYDNDMEHAWSCYHTPYPNCETCPSTPTIPNPVLKQCKQMPAHNHK